jgi:hypothetical protein
VLGNEEVEFCTVVVGGVEIVDVVGVGIAYERGVALVAG